MNESYTTYIQQVLKQMNEWRKKREKEREGGEKKKKKRKEKKG